MSDSFDVQNLLQAGYFTTSRAKRANSPNQQPEERLPPISQPVPPTEPRHSRVPPTLKRRQYPPSVSVEDEEESLAKEHEALLSPDRPEEEPQSRGEIEQQPIMLEVHEHNPERRFVILDSASPTKESNAERDWTDQAKRSDARGAADAPFGANTRRRDEFEPKPRPPPKSPVSDTRPTLERRKSRQDLPPIDTDWANTQHPEHHRSRSATQAPQDYFSPHASRKNQDGLLSPEIIKAGSGRREKGYYKLGQSYGGTGRSEDRRYERDSDRRDQRSPSAKPPPSQADPNKPRRRMSNERVAHPRYSEGHISPGSKVREYARSSRGGEGKPDAIPTDRRTDNGRSDDEHSQAGIRTTVRRRRQSNVVHDDREPILSPGRSTDSIRLGKSPARAPTMPISISSPRASGQDVVTPSPRSSATFHVVDQDRKPRDRPVSQVPYPEDFDPRISRVDIQDGSARPGRPRSKHGPAVSMPDLPLPPKSLSAADFAAASPPIVLSPVATPGTSRPWQPPPFDPERDGVMLDRPMGSIRRHSESLGKEDPQVLPDCPRTQPVAGMMDWLTLPHTDFNICPQCYLAVFEQSEYRTHFKLMLRPADRPIACDFGLSPWYRIAWLLILKNGASDLRLFHQVANVMDPVRNERCPQDRTTSRKWYVVRDPQTRRPVPEFTVCYQCASTVEILLPSLLGVFVPETWPEPLRSRCALHYKPKKQFVLFFDAFETTSDKAMESDRSPSIAELAQRLERLTLVSKCREDNPICNGYWHTMQYLPEFTVCGQCFTQIVQPRLKEGNVIARNFFKNQQQLSSATCQLYSDRMREVFKKACRRNDPKYLGEKVRERMLIEADVHTKLIQLDKYRNDDQVQGLMREWRKWE